jgi:hypothetical protein
MVKDSKRNGIDRAPKSRHKPIRANRILNKYFTVGLYWIPWAQTNVFCLLEFFNGLVLFLFEAAEDHG